MSTEQLRELAHELRYETISAVAATGGHLGASLGVVELTVAIHAVFNTPYDKLIWDVGHQCYPHKIVTGRRDRIRTLRQGRGLSGFTKRSESPYDPFGAAHSSTSISAGLGFTVARDLGGGDRRRRRGDRRRRDLGRHGLRGDEQRRRRAAADVRHPQRQRDVDRAAGRCDVEVPLGASTPTPRAPFQELRDRRRLARTLPEPFRRARGGRTSW